MVITWIHAFFKTHRTILLKWMHFIMKNYSSIRCVCIYVYLYIYIYIYVCVCVCVCVYLMWDFPDDASGKEPPCQCRLDIRGTGLIPRSGRSPGGGH